MHWVDTSNYRPKTKQCPHFVYFWQYVNLGYATRGGYNLLYFASLRLSDCLNSLSNLINLVSWDLVGSIKIGDKPYYSRGCPVFHCIDYGPLQHSHDPCQGGGEGGCFLSFLRLLSVDLSCWVIMLLGSLTDLKQLVTLARNLAIKSASILFVYWNLLIANSVSVIISDTGISGGMGEKFCPNWNTLVSADESFVDNRLTIHLNQNSYF